MFRTSYRAAATAIAMLALAGCGAGTDTNGLEAKSAAEVQQEAAAALKGAMSVHVTGKGTSEDGVPAELDFRLQGESGSGILTVGGKRVEIIAIDRVVYVRGDEQTLAAAGMPESAAHRAAGKWVKAQSGQLINMEGFRLDEMAEELTKFDSPLLPKVEQTTLDGRKVVVISQENGSKLYVANTGPAYPLRLEKKGDDPGQTDFTEYGADFPVTAPADAIDYDELTEPASNDELAWLESISAVRNDIDKTYAAVGNDYEESEVAMLARTLRGASTKLLEAKAPTSRMQPIYDIVVLASQEYDKGAASYETIHSKWNAPPDDATMNELFNSGKAARTKGGELLNDAVQKGLKIVGAS